MIDIDRIAWYNKINFHGLQSDGGGGTVRSGIGRNRQSFSDYAGVVGFPCDSCR